MAYIRLQVHRIKVLWQYVVITALLLGGVYWFIYNPSLVRQACAEEAQQTFNNSYTPIDQPITDSEASQIMQLHALRLQDRENDYEFCLHKWGLSE